MKTILNALIFLVVAGGIYFGYKMLKSSDTPIVATGNETATNNDPENNNKKAGTTYAVIVGVSDYKYLPSRPTQGRPNPNVTYDLNFCDDDANLFYSFLRSSAGGNVPAENIVKLIDGQATQANIVAQTRQLFSKSSPDDRVIFYFTGHGSHQVLCPYDVTTTSGNMLEYRTIAGVFRECRARDRFFIADACNTGSMKTHISSQHGSASSLPKDKTLLAFMASKSTQSSRENLEISHGYFTYFLDKGARGEADFNHDNVVTIKELYAFVKINVEAKTRKGLPKNAPEKYYQTPIAFGKYPDNLSFATLN
ncbi:caspase family protein [Runella sp.]|uniref:caspase family protein n=1 Tax=Runella sp. TaxID=1960881 RepID=UPI003D14618B